MQQCLSMAKIPYPFIRRQNGTYFQLQATQDGNRADGVKGVRTQMVQPRTGSC